MRDQYRGPGTEKASTKIPYLASGRGNIFNVAGQYTTLSSRFFTVDLARNICTRTDDVGYKVVGLRARDSETENVIASIL